MSSGDLGPVGVGLFAAWHHMAAENVQEWGLQDPETLLLAMQEELGELTQARLEEVHEDGDREAVIEELLDLGSLLIQLNQSLQEASIDEY